MHLQASDGRFSLSFWFTHNHCENINATGQWEPLYHHGGEECDGCPIQQIGVFISCNSTLMMERGGGYTEAVQGVNSLSIWMIDDDMQMVEVSIPFSMDDSRDATGQEDHLGATDGSVLSHWIHFGMSVNGDEMTVYIDGSPVREFGKIRDFWMHFESFDVILSRLDVKLLRPGTDAMASGWGTNLAEGHLSRRDMKRSGTVQLSAPLSGVSLGASHTHTCMRMRSQRVRRGHS